MSGFKGPFLGFSFGTKEDGETPMHSSDLGIVRISNGGRFTENLLPTIQDKTVQVPGGDGFYFFNSYFTQRQFSIAFAFDNLNDEQIRKLKAHFGDKKIHDLIFDEAPYKKYQAKVTGTAQIKHMVFDEGAGRERVYKGEGTLQFTSYSPYALSTKKGLDEYVEKVVDVKDPTKYYVFDNLNNCFVKSTDTTPNNDTKYYTDGVGDNNKWSIAEVNEWAATSRLTETWADFTQEWLRENDWAFFNAGDIDAPFQFGLHAGGGETIPGGTMRLDIAGDYLSWKDIKLEQGDDGVIFDSTTHLIEGYKGRTGEEQKTGTVYNQFIIGGDFFCLPQGNDAIKFSGLEGASSNPRSYADFFRYDYYYI